MNGLKLAIIGATGLVGRELLAIIEHEQPLLKTVGLYASEQSAGEQIAVLGKTCEVKLLTHCDFSAYDAAFFCVGDELSAQYVPVAIDAGCAVVDKSNAYRLDPQVPLVVPGVNDDAITTEHRLIANPNCTTIVLLHALGPVFRRFGGKRAFIATFQSVSGGGKGPVSELFASLAGLPCPPHELRALKPDPAQIAYNVLPQIGRLNEVGQAGEEAKLINESQKILTAPELVIACHAVRVPVAIGHSIAVTLELEQPATRDEIIELWDLSPAVRWMDDELPTPVGSSQHEQAEVGRLRQEPHLSNTWSFFVAGDNLRLGAALNGWRILKLMEQQGALMQTLRGAK